MSDTDFKKTHFELFGLQPQFEIDLPRLDQSYRDIQARVHPDRFTHLSDVERRVSMQWATRTNEAYQVLKNPLRRADYLLQLVGIDALAQTNTAMPADFLVAQMEWREAISEAQNAGDQNALIELQTSVDKAAQHLVASLAKLLNDEKNFLAASDAVRKLKFMEKLQQEIEDAIERG